MAKKIIVGFLLFSFLGLQAQNLSYAEKKEMFPAKGYKYQKGDAYSPAVASIFSFIIPGLGQVYANEPLRGLNFFCR